LIVAVIFDRSRSSSIWAYAVSSVSNVMRSPVPGSTVSTGSCAAE